MEIKYTRQGDYLIPNLYLEKDEELTHHLLLVSDSCESL